MGIEMKAKGKTAESEYVKRLEDRVRRLEAVLRGEDRFRLLKKSFSPGKQNVFSLALALQDKHTELSSKLLSGQDRRQILVGIYEIEREIKRNHEAIAAVLAE
jgi:hypothetical protein